MTLDAVWTEMEQTAVPAGEGHLQRRIKPESPFDLFIGVDKPTNRRLLLLTVSPASIVGIEPPASSQGVEAALAADGSTALAVLGLRLLDGRYASIFTVLASDLIDTVVASADEHAAVRAFLTRWQRWQQFLQRAGASHLSPEAQQGLFAELWFLRAHLLDRLSPGAAVDAWTGPDASDQDFQLPGCAIEVKSSTSGKPQHFVVSSERQLDDTGVDTLILFHLSLDARRGGGETLAVIVDDIRRVLDASDAALARFDERLLSAGYLDAHRDYYNVTGYTIREPSAFRVRPGFPRLVEADLPHGVGGVSYMVALTACVSFTVDEAFLVNAITGF